LNAIKELGFAVSEQELEEQISAVSAPIFGPGGQPIASIAVAGPTYRLTRERLLEIGPNLVATSKQISQEINMSAIPMANSSFPPPAAIK
jgi:IclR family acetate operon transcriptional repressor